MKTILYQPIFINP
jgi:hypothetical protein